MKLYKYDPIATKLAEKGVDAQAQRLQVLKALKAVGRAVTAMELSRISGLDYSLIQRRVSEIAEIKRGIRVRDIFTGTKMSLLELR